VAHYDVLGLPFDADSETIHRAYRHLVRKYHPDVGAGSSPEKFRQLTEAYQTLSDPQQRAVYDKELHRSSRPVPEPLIPDQWEVAAAPPFSSMTAGRHHRHFAYVEEEPFVIFEQLIEHIFREMEQLFF